MTDIFDRYSQSCAYDNHAGCDFDCGGLDDAGRDCICACHPPLRRAISIRQPFAWLIAEGVKPLENRDCKGDRVTCEQEHAEVDEDGCCWQCGADCVEEVCGPACTSPDRNPGDPLNAHPSRTRDRFAIVFRDVVKLREPVKAKGSLGLWRVPASIAAKVLETSRLQRMADELAGQVARAAQYLPRRCW